MPGDDSDSISAQSAGSHAEHGEGVAAEPLLSATDSEEASIPPPAGQLDPGLYLVGTPIGECSTCPHLPFVW